MDSTAVKIEEALKRNDTIVIAGECEVQYSGRAEAFLPLGERLLILKSDKAFLVHQPLGHQPINYMRPDSSHSIVVEDGKLVIYSKNVGNKDFMTVKLTSVHFINSTKLNDGQKIQIMGTEKDMSEMIYNTPLLISEDFKPLSMEEHTKYGFIDVFGHDKEGNIVIVECKRFRADLSAVTQLRRYVEKIAAAKGIELGKIKGIIAAPKITGNAEQMLNDWGYSFISVKPPNFHEKWDKKQSTLDAFGK
ncbi:endonuclease NucS [Nanoarchaeota archaeon]